MDNKTNAPPLPPPSDTPTAPSSLPPASPQMLNSIPSVSASPSILNLGSSKHLSGRTRSGSEEGRQRLASKLKELAKEVVGKEDCWAKYDIASIPAERIKRHQYDPATDSWRDDESIVRIQSQPFDEGAMRQCYRMKKLSQLPSDATNHSYHKIDWNQAPNYVAKTYKTPDGSINTSTEGREACFGDIKLQYEAAHWAEEFNKSDPPKKIHIIRAYAIEFLDRTSSPVMTVERFIDGSDEYGAGYVKHNTNSGFVDTDMKRLTPQLFSAHSFYASKGRRMVVDVQGVGDLYTDPQVHSLDLRFGEADLGLRGFALFFHSFQHTDLAFALGIPRFELSRNERREQDKKAGRASPEPPPTAGGESPRKKSIAFQADQLKLLRKMATDDAKGLKVGGDKKVGKGKRRKTAFPVMGRKGSGRMNDTITCLLEEQTLEDQRVRGNSAQDYARDVIENALKPPIDPFSYMKKIDTADLDRRGVAHAVFDPDADTRATLGRVHLEIAMLYGAGRFSEGEGEVVDLDSAFFHICRGAMFNDPKALVTLARAMMSLSTDDVCEDVDDILDANGLRDDFGVKQAAELLKRAAKAEGGTVHDEKEVLGAKVSAITLLLKYAKPEAEARIVYGEMLLALMGEGGGGGEEVVQLQVGDKVSAAYGGGDSWYEAVVREVGEDGNVKVFYIEDQEEEVLTSKYVKAIEGSGGRAAAGGFGVGDKVKAAYGGGESFYDAEVRELGGDGRIKVYYPEDDEEEWLPEKYVKGAMEGGEEEGAGEGEEEARGGEEEDEGGIEVYEVYEIIANAFVEKGSEEKGKEMFGKASEAAAKAGLASKAMELGSKS
ncbi:hypothetical protein TrCOL_g6273 [Triparma columacea]|uniref:Alpha-type protein kinase domain-containing protein n=1 Tax=Triparma columacea TaxID=722753 RepID=A0A9W7L7X8_9STRA|nr:hypothetical protein TrCOL_g6273 [Triparma columacea]